MRKLNSLCALAVSCLLFVACSKDDDNNITPNPPAPANETEISTPPGTYSKKVILEYHTAAWCSTCPDADAKRDQVMSSFTGKVIPVAIHQSDAMQTPLFMTIDATFGSNPTYGMVNRIPTLNNVLLNRTQWMSNASVQLNGTAKCGLAINSTVVQNSASIEVQAAFRESLSGNINLTVYLVESDVTGTGSGYDQANSYNTDPSSAYYNQGNPILGFKHKYVVRKVLTANLGEVIDPSKLVADGIFKKNYTVDITGMNKDKLTVVAFVNGVGSSSTTHQIFNAQVGQLGVLKNWD